MSKIKVLNLYAGIGGNRKLWSPSMERLNSDSNENKNKEVKR